MIVIGIWVVVVWVRQEGETLPFTMIYEDMGWNLDPNGDSGPFPNQDFLVIYHPLEAEPYFPHYLLSLVQQQDFDKNVIIYVQGDTPVLAPIKIIEVKLVNENPFATKIEKQTPKKPPRTIIDGHGVSLR